MSSFVVKSVFAAALVIAPLVASPLDSPFDPSKIFPAPIPLMNFSPNFSGHPSDLTLLASRRASGPGAVKGTLVLKRSEDTPPRQPSPITQANAANFRFDAHLPDSPTGLVTPQTGTVTFKSNLWFIQKKAN